MYKVRLSKLVWDGMKRYIKDTSKTKNETERETRLMVLLATLKALAAYDLRNGKPVELGNIEKMIMRAQRSSDSFERKTLFKKISHEFENCFCFKK